MNLRTTYILFGVLLVVLIVFALTQFWGAKPGASTEQYVFADFHAKDAVKTSDLDEVRVERPDKPALVFKRKDGWQMTEPLAARTDPYQVDNLVRQVTEAEREKGEMSSNLKEYGLDPPTAVVVLKKEGKEWKMNVGKQVGSVVYVSNAATPDQPLAVRKTGLDAVFKNANDFRSRELLTANTSNTSAVELAAGDKVLALEKTSDGRWRFQKPPYGPANFEGEPAAAPLADKKVSGVHELIDDAGGLRVEAEDDFVANNVSDADLASKYGLDKDKPETLRVEMKVTPAGGEAKTETLLVGKKAEKKAEEKNDEKKPEEKKPDDKAEYYYVRLAGENSVERVPAAKVKALLEVAANPDPLRSRDLVPLTATAKIDAIDVQVGGDTAVKLRQVDNRWKLYSGGARATDFDAVRDLLDALTGKKKVLTFVDKTDGLDFDKPSAVVSAWIDGVKKDEKKEEKPEDEKKEEKKDDKEPGLKSDKPTVKLTFGKRDRDKQIIYVLRESGEDKTVVTVPEGVYEKVTAGPLTYVDRQLPTFATDFNPAKEVTKLALQRGDQTWEVAKETAGDKATWKLTQPESAKGRAANDSSINGVLLDLAHLKADRIVTEKPKDSDLELYGLKKPETKVTVTVTKDGKSEDWVYTFGKQSDTKMGVYAQLNKSDFVFQVPKLTVDRINGADLRDPTVFNFEMAKVKAAKIAGWSHVIGSVYTLDLERKGDRDWAVKAPAGFEVNGAVVEGFIGGLGHLRAGRFVTPKDDPELDVNKGALQVEITVEGEKPLTLTVGKEDPDNKESYFAKSSTQGDAVFLVPKLSFEKAKEKPAYFKK